MDLLSTKRNSLVFAVWTVVVHLPVCSFLGVSCRDPARSLVRAHMPTGSPKLM